MCRLCFGAGKAIAAAAGARTPRPLLPVPRAPSGLSDRHEVFDFPLGGTGLDDAVANDYLADLLAAINAAPANAGASPRAARLAAVEVDSDGNCLFHAVSRAIFGREVFYAEIRAHVAAELAAHEGWYLKHVYFGSRADFEADLHDARTTGEWSSTNQLGAVANVLRRPVALLASLAHMRGGAPGGPAGTAVYLPARHPARECATNPLLLAWQTGEGSHFVALCRVAGAAAPEVPPECRPPGTAPSNFSQEAYIPVGCFCLSAQPPDNFDKRNPINNPGAAEVKALAIAGRAARATLHARAQAAATSAATLSLLLDDDFMDRAQSEGLLSLEAIVQHVAERDAATALYAACGVAPANDSSDAAADAALAHVLDGLPPHTAAALRRCISKEAQAALWLLAGKHVNSLNVEHFLRIGVASATMEAQQSELYQQVVAANAAALQAGLLAGAPAEQPAEPAAAPAGEAPPPPPPPLAAVQLSDEERECRWQAHLAAATLRGVVLSRRARPLGCGGGACGGRAATLPGRPLKASRMCTHPRRNVASLDRAAGQRSAEPLGNAKSAPAALSPHERLSSAASAPARLAPSLSEEQMAKELVGRLRSDTRAGAEARALSLPPPPAALAEAPSAEARESAILRTLSGVADASVLGKRKSYPDSDADGEGEGTA